MNSILQHTGFKRFLFALQYFSLSLNISIQYFQSERTSELSQSLGAVKCNSQEIIITRGKKRALTSCVSLSRERQKYEKEINGFLVEKQALEITPCG